MVTYHYPKVVGHWIAGQTRNESAGTISKYAPGTGVELGAVAQATSEIIQDAVTVAQSAFAQWTGMSAVERGAILRACADQLRAQQQELAHVVALECGRSVKDALGEVRGAIECAYYFAGESRRLYGRTLQSAVPHRKATMERVPIGTGALIIPFNTPAAGVAWKVFPALLAGNTVVLKAHELVPYTPILMARLMQEAGLPDGVFNVVQGDAFHAGIPLVEHEDIHFISFTGSHAAGSDIVRRSAGKLKKVSIESGGKNPFVVCDDADIDRAVESLISSAFVDAGQRCAAASRAIIMESIYDDFAQRFLARVRMMRVGHEDHDDMSAIISKDRLQKLISAIDEAAQRGVRVLTGGKIVHSTGFYMEPTVLEGITPDDDLAQSELFGPVVALFRVRNLNEGILIANHARFKLSGALHTSDMNKAYTFIRKYHSGVVRINGPTHGSEPHMSFGGIGLSGNGWREPGEAALDFYCDWRQISIDYQISE